MGREVKCFSLASAAGILPTLGLDAPPAERGPLQLSQAWAGGVEVRPVKRQEPCLREPPSTGC